MPKNTSAEKEPQKMRRYIVLFGMVSLVFILYVLRLADWQLVQGADYAKKSKEQQTGVMKLEPARGEILDKNGEVLAGNRIANQVIFNAVNLIESRRNETIIKVLTLLQERGEEWVDTLPILVDEAGNYVFDEEKKSELEYLKSNNMLNLQDYATAQDCINALIKLFSAQGYSTQVTRDLLSVRYLMRKSKFSVSNPYVFAQDVSMETVGAINELQNDLPGIETKVTTTRYYGEDGTTAPHVVGSYKTITEAMYAAEEEKGNLYDSTENLSGYAMTDKAGRDGLERAFETYLRGDNGKMTILSDSNSKVVSTNVITAPKEGSTVVTTMDAKLQRTANASLKENVEGNDLSDRAISGAVVALNVKDNGVLVSASYPTYDLGLAQTDDKYYNELIKNEEQKPLFDRALQGAFTPGSVYKPLVAIAGLQEGAIGYDTVFNCEGVWMYYDTPMTCLQIHGFENVYGAITDSCNIFFYHTSELLGIEPMNAYSRYFGLGEYTGVETGENKGTLSSPEEYAARGGTWVGGSLLNAGIGQMDTLLTPIQLATYASTIANGGVRYETHFLDKVVDYATGEVLETYEPTVVADAKISGSIINEVTAAMINVGRNGTASSVFADYPVAVACKTGTAQVAGNDGNEKNAHVTFIAFAPADDPEIAVAVVMEHGFKGNWAMNVAKDVLDAYFGYDTAADSGEEDEAAATPTPVPTATPKPVDGATLTPGAFFDPDKDLPKATPTPEPSSSSQNSEGT